MNNTDREYFDIHGFTFEPFASKGRLWSDDAKESLRLMRERTGADLVTFVPLGLQLTAHSENIFWFANAADMKKEGAFGEGAADKIRNMRLSDRDPLDFYATDDELVSAAAYAHSLGMRVAIKPTVNCMDGTWRAFINFFDEDVPCEPKWSNWFKSYTAFQVYYASLAEKIGAELFITGCEMVMSDRRENEWRDLIKEVRKVYNGLVTYNCDKYQEHHVEWWDCLDLISSSGYYPSGMWAQELDRIERVSLKYDKPFFFSECGCMSGAGCNKLPNDWSLRGQIDMKCQSEWFDEMLREGAKREWLLGHVIWSWTSALGTEEERRSICDYEVYGKDAEKMIATRWKKN